QANRMVAVLAPFDGTITRLEFDDGEWVTRGTTLARVESVGALRIRTAVPVPALECMSIGATVGWRPHTRPTAAGGTATVDFVSPRLDESSGLMLVELEPDQPVDSAVPGEQIALHAPCWQ
nr:HlyD family efflux transporter periplasmic adaptor subunit [Deltaproteobacteria bacterium]